MFLPFHTINGVLLTRIQEWIVISFSNGSCFFRTLHYDPSVFGGPAWHGSASELHKPLCHNKAVIHEGHWELYWGTYSSFCYTTFSHFSGNFIIPSSQSFFFFLSKELFQVLYTVFQGIEIFSVKRIEVSVSRKYSEWIKTSQPSCNSFFLVVK